MVEKSARSQVSFKIPMFYKLFERNKVIKGGLRQAAKMKIANSDDLVVEYGGREPLPGGSKDIIGTQKFNVAHMMHPIEIEEFDEIANLPKSDGKLLDKAEEITESATEGLRIRAAKRIWGCATDQEKNEYETLLQGIPSALMPISSTYGFVTRSSTSNEFYMPAGYANATTEYNLSKRLLREWISLARKYASKPGPCVVILGTTLYNRLKDEFEASNSYHPTGDEAKQGFRTMTLDGTEIMEDPFLDDMTTTTLYHEDGTPAGLFGDMSSCGSTCGGNLANYTGANCVFVLHPDSWKFRYVPQPLHDGKKNGALIEITDPFDQSQIAGGAAVKLSRAFLHGNICCEQPNINLARLNVH